MLIPRMQWVSEAYGLRLTAVAARMGWAVAYRRQCACLRQFVGEEGVDAGGLAREWCAACNTTAQLATPQQGLQLSSTRHAARRRQPAWQLAMSMRTVFRLCSPRGRGQNKQTNKQTDK